MGRRGPKPQPTALRVDRGNPGKRALPVGEPALSAFPREVPKGMKGRARQEWLRLVDELADKGVLTLGDVRVFERYCRLVAAEADAVKLIDSMELEKVLSEKHDRYLDRLQNQLSRHEQQLGLTPSSRSAIKAVKVPQRDEAATKRERFFGKSA